MKNWQMRKKTTQAGDGPHLMDSLEQEIYLLFFFQIKWPVLLDFSETAIMLFFSLSCN